MDRCYGAIYTLAVVGGGKRDVLIPFKAHEFIKSIWVKYISMGETPDEKMAIVLSLAAVVMQAVLRSASGEISRDELFSGGTTIHWSDNQVVFLQELSRFGFFSDSRFGFLQ